MKKRIGKVLLLLCSGALVAVLLNIVSLPASVRFPFLQSSEFGESYAMAGDGTPSSGLSAGEISAQASIAEAEYAAENARIGVWREGKAVFSDLKIFDVFWKYARGYTPTQPIKYSHLTHAGKNQMECTYCHSGVAKSPFATIPSLESCMGCHKLVRPELPEVKKMKESFDRGKPIEWVPVNNLPEHVFFTHERHVKAGVACATCHGQVQMMAEVEKVSSLKMGWCVSCHRENGASIDCATCHQ